MISIEHMTTGSLPERPADPALGTTYTVPNNIAARVLLYSVQVTATAVNKAEIAFAIDGLATTQLWRQPAADTTARFYGGCSVVPGGHSYQWTGAQLTGTTEAVTGLQFVDIV